VKVGEGSSRFVAKSRNPPSCKILPDQVIDDVYDLFKKEIEKELQTDI